MGAPAYDYDGDGLANLGEYALNGSPTNASSVGQAPSLIYSGGLMRYVHPQRSDDSNLSYMVEVRTNLMYGVWINAGVTVTGTNVTGSTLNYVTNQLPDADPNLYIRLKSE